MPPASKVHLPLSLQSLYRLSDIVAENFTDVVLPIQAGTLMKDVINENCKACHAATNMDVASMESKRYCTDCHRNVPHQRTMPVSTRMVAYE